MIRTVVATRYVTPLREGGSLPAIVEADDDGTYVLKFRGAGQGPKALVAELLAGELGRALGLPVPEMVFVELDTALGRSEPDSEIQALIQNSVGLNLALDYLPGSLGFDPLLAPPPDSKLASEIVWFDSLVTNVDRTPRNPNLLVWHRRLYMIDHGAALYFHHLGGGYRKRARRPFPQVRDHVLLPLAAELPEADERLGASITPDAVRSVVELAPDEWLGDEPGFESCEERREAYTAYLLDRLTPPRLFAQEAIDARAELV